MAQMSQVQELFHEAAQQEALAQPQPWWKIQLFIWEPVLFGTWDGVFTSCMINIFGVVLFLRTGWLVGNTGVLVGVFLVSFVALVALVTVLSGIGVGEHCDVGTGGVYSMIAAVLGGQTGGAIGLLYVFGQCVAGAMYITGFAESISDLLSLRNLWAVRGISVAVLLALLGINLAGVKWIIRLQLLLLLLLAVSTLDFVVGSFTHLDPEHGFIGYSPELLQNNTLPDYSPGESFFTVFAVFFPAATGEGPEEGKMIRGVCSSPFSPIWVSFRSHGRLQHGGRPQGACCQHPPGLPSSCWHLLVMMALLLLARWFLYIVFVLVLGAICTRGALRYDFLIAEKVSLVGFLFLLGLYISSLASCMGGLYGAPRILQCIAQEKVIPALACLGQGKGPSKTPVAAICLTSLVTMAFVLVGQVNVLAPIVTINFMLTYIAVDYSYFSLSMGACSLPQVPESVPGEGLGALHCSEHLLLEKAPSCGSEGVAWNLSEGTLLEFTKDMDQLLQLTRKLASSQPGGGESHGIPENQKGKTKKATKQTLQESFLLDPRSPASFPPEGCDGWPTASWEGQGPHGNMPSSRSEGAQPGGACGEQLIPEPSNQPRPSREDFFLKSRLQEQDIQRRPTSFYTRICNPWVSLLGAVGSLLIMFVIQWVYTLVNMGVAAIVYLYIGWTSSGLHLDTLAARMVFPYSFLLSAVSSRIANMFLYQLIPTPTLLRTLQ
ncbi:hypothetical protein EI555_002083 [Monodon monoceros]|uniref:Amino acid permease/ SLC12A domain-containing protein n=1 Tax=Monodon monoceros TaxID=40151 RepID=A0A4U1F854_MONMO|nr:hypothetical protein EI555_002083 [Monodon monoceros]